MGINKFDKRLLGRKVRKGEITEEEKDAFLASLSDISDNVSVVEARLGVEEEEEEAASEEEEAASEDEEEVEA